jgi:hypothetical protein
VVSTPYSAAPCNAIARAFLVVLSAVMVPHTPVIRI